MSSCATIPTETQFATQIVTSNSLSTTFSISITTGPPTIITNSVTTCLDPVTTGTCSSFTVVDNTITQPGAIKTISVPTTVTIPVTATSLNPTKTLFSTSCTPTNPSFTPSTSPTTFLTPTSLSSDTLTVTSASSLTLSNGSVEITSLVLTSTVAASSVVVTTAAPSFNNGGSSGHPRNTAPIVGGVVGGVVGLLAIIGGIWYIWRRSQHWNDIFDQEEDDKVFRRRMSLGEEVDVQPKPYHYGLVGHSGSPSPPGSPPLRASYSHSPSNSMSLLNAPPLAHSRTSSGGSIDTHGAVPNTVSDVVAASSSGHVRPNTSSSTAASTRPLLERPVHPSRPHSSRSLHTQSQSISSTTELFDSQRPHTPGSPPASGALAVSSPSNEKRRLLEVLPPGAASPIPPTPAIPGPEASSASSPPPLKARSPRRPSSSGTSTVLVHTDGGSTPGPTTEPPAYSPT